MYRVGQEHRVSLYADDLLLYISDPISNIPHIIHALKHFGIFSGYKLNLNKSECYSVNDLALQIQEKVCPFKWSRDGFKYLGISITGDILKL